MKALPFKQPIRMNYDKIFKWLRKGLLMQQKIFKVPFYAIELCLNKCYAKVKAEDAIEAYKIVQNAIDDGSIFNDIDADWDGENTVTEEVIETEQYQIDGYTVEDVVEVSSKIGRKKRKRRL